MVVDTVAETSAGVAVLTDSAFNPCNRISFCNYFYRDTIHHISDIEAMKGLRYRMQVNTDEKSKGLTTSDLSSAAINICGQLSAQWPRLPTHV